jgi:xanthine/CO dehydrogenase XdhC/CoxF family maturation factor
MKEQEELDEIQRKEKADLDAAIALSIAAQVITRLRQSRLLFISIYRKIKNTAR